MPPKNLIQEQKDNRKNICSDIKKQLTEELDLITNVITGDETWISQNDSETKRQTMHGKSLRMKRRFLVTMQNPAFSHNLKVKF